MQNKIYIVDDDSNISEFGSNFILKGKLQSKYL